MRYLLLAVAIPIALRDADEAFTRNDFATAERLYAQASATTLDPAHVAFNRAACLFALERYAAAEEAYRQALSAPDMPAARSARCAFDLATCLLMQAGPKDRDRLAEACTLLEQSRANLEPPLAIDAARRLEIARTRWRKAATLTRTQTPIDPPPPPEIGTEPKREPKTGPPEKSGANEPKQVETQATPKDVKQLPEAKASTQPPKPGAGLLPVLLDESAALPSPAQAEELLRAAVKRLHRERSRIVPRGGAPHANDW